MKLLSPITSLSGRLRWPDLRLFLMALFAFTTLHICATFLASRIHVSPAYARLAPALDTNKMAVLPPVTPDNQPLPFMSPDVRIALCRFDTKGGRVVIRTPLAGPGWSLTLYDPTGSAIYATLVPSEQGEGAAVLIVPNDGRFSGLSPEAQGQRGLEQQPRTHVEAAEGLAVIRAPDSGYAHRERVEAELRRATCKAQT